MTTLAQGGASGTSCRLDAILERYGRIMATRAMLSKLAPSGNVEEALAPLMDETEDLIREAAGVDAEGLHSVLTKLELWVQDQIPEGEARSDADALMLSVLEDLKRLAKG